jgi:hypothetical protein
LEEENNIMSSKLYDLSIRAYLAIEELKQKLERGDADSSGSTLRTVGVVALVLIVVAVLGFGIYIAANNASTTIAAGNFSFAVKPAP